MTDPRHTVRIAVGATSLGVSALGATLPACSAHSGPGSPPSAPSAPAAATVMVEGHTHTISGVVECRTSPAVRTATPSESGTQTTRVNAHDDSASVTLSLSDSTPPDVLDARVPERFRGDVEPVDAVAGHIPGAINVPSGSVLADDGTFLGNGALNALLSDHGIDHGGRVGVYCGSGVSAAVIVAALAVIGQDAELFPGSWSEWSSDPTRPVGRGTA